MKPKSPELTCTIQTYDLAAVRSNSSPDSNFENIISQLNERIIYLPNYPHPLKHGDKITVFGQQAMGLKKIIDNLNDDGQGTTVIVDYYGMPQDPNQGPWTIDFGSDGSAVEVSDNYWEMVGPNDENGQGWIYIKKQFPAGAKVTFEYSWDTDDSDGCCDWVISNVTTNEPHGLPLGSIDNQINPETPYTGTLIQNAKPGEWIFIGIYSEESCCGAGLLNFTIIES